MKELLEEKWDEILLYLKDNFDVTDVSYKTFLCELSVYSVEGNKITVAINDKAIGDSKDFIIRKFGVYLPVSIEEVTGLHCEVTFELLSILSSSSNSQKDENDDNILDKLSFLNPRYTFDTFVVGGNNDFAHAASLAVAEAPGEIYNPLFIYGGVGLGKTHLMHAIARYIGTNNKDMKILYVTSEDFTNEVIDSIRNARNNSTNMQDFRNKYRNVDVLLIDDIQFIIGKESTQEEFFHTFNHLYGAKKQIIISSDNPPNKLEHLEDRLRSRFKMGLTVDVKSPNYETRMAILRKKAELDDLSIDDGILNYIATNIESNIRELEGAVNKIVALSRLKHREITMDLAEEALQDLINPNKKKVITIDTIKSVICEHYSISEEDLISKKKNSSIAYPRQICMYLCREMINTAKLKDIGAQLGNRDHTTVLHGIKKIEDDLSANNDEDLQKTIHALMEKVNHI